MDTSSLQDLALLVLRLGIGLALAAHGAQKLFGWFGGGGLDGTATAFDSMGFRPGKVNAALAGLGETGGGLLIALGLLTPLGGLAALATMLVAGSVHKRTFFALNEGFELSALYALGAVVVILGGPGAYSVDAALGYPLAATWIPFAALAVAVVAALGAISGRKAALKVPA
ncbi:DoxX family protein [Kribbella sandramycini]|uniref:DoxX family protein n=1 Tax=Kribbella sandramycini TaxID=60450 RepID=A0A7Y4KVX0_9ACTN|nr:DoxX family protein [Kribbella sandramycini]MBB6567736.1 putative oxidoreductase [Kribbella sandramycini]NOL39668.1 DoxX family protein [Kribbella sandramycini]